jgi:Subtilase family
VSRRRSGAHGTHVMDIAGGSGGRGEGMGGVAPEADLVFVHLARTTDVLGKGNLGDSASLLEALDFVFSVAGDRPCVVNLSVGAHGGSHDGTTLVEQGIDRAVWLQGGRAVVGSIGNYAVSGAHRHGRLRQGEEEALGLRIPVDDPTANELEVWYGWADRFTTPPSWTPRARRWPRSDPAARRRSWWTGAPSGMSITCAPPAMASIISTCS